MTPVDRRGFLTKSLTALGAGGVGLATGVGLESGSAGATTTDLPLAEQANAIDLKQLNLTIPFDGTQQAGILTPRQDQATLIAFDSIAPDSGTLFEALQALTTASRQLTQGSDVGVAELDDPPPDSGILGAYNTPDSLTVTVGFGSTLFDDRYGLAAKLPAGLIEMKPFPQDELDPTLTGGDLIVQIAAGQRDTVMHTARTLVFATAGKLQPRWMIDGFQLAYRGPHSFNSRRNLFAFRDGTGNPDVNDVALMNKLVWVDRQSADPGWTAGGTNMVVRRIRMFVEFWDRVGMLEQEQMIGRERVTGAPLGGTNEFENPDYGADPKGLRIPLSAHIRTANNRTPEQEAQRILRRPYSYNAGVDEAGNLDQGMLFIAFNRDIHAQFEQIQRRLENEPMIDYIKPVGGGYFFRSPRSGRAGRLGRLGPRLSGLNQVASGPQPGCRT